MEEKFALLVYLFCIAVNSVVCWNQTANIHGFFGTPHNFSTLDECKAECVNNKSCVAVDWQPSNVGRKCWILTLTFVRTTTEKGVIVHYELHRECPS